jgi:hypothetical protein
VSSLYILSILTTVLITFRQFLHVGMYMQHNYVFVPSEILPQLVYGVGGFNPFLSTRYGFPGCHGKWRESAEIFLTVHQCQGLPVSITMLYV